MYLHPPSGLGRLKIKVANGCLALSTAVCLSQLPSSPTGIPPWSQRAVPTYCCVMTPICSVLVPVAWVKRQFSSCSQYQSDESSSMVRRRSSACRNALTGSSGPLALLRLPIPMARFSRLAPRLNDAFSDEARHKHFYEQAYSGASEPREMRT